MGRTPSESVADAVGENDGVDDDVRDFEAGATFCRAAVVVDLEVADPVAVDDDVLVPERLTVVDGAADADEGCVGPPVAVAIAVGAALRVAVAVADTVSVAMSDGTVAAADEEGSCDEDALVDSLDELELNAESEHDDVELGEVDELAETDAESYRDADSSDDAEGKVDVVPHTLKDAELDDETVAADGDGSLEIVLIAVNVARTLSAAETVAANDS